MNQNHKIYQMPVAKVYPHYVTKIVKKGRKQDELDALIYWLTGYDKVELENVISHGIDFETFFKEAPNLNPNRSKITGVICGIRVESMEPSTMKEIRYLDKVVDELAKGKSLEKIKRQ